MARNYNIREHVQGHRGLYDYDVVKVKRLGSSYRIVRLAAVRTSGLVVDTAPTKKCTVNDEKLDNNLSRAKSRLRELALCNEWDFFMTFTLDKSKYDRYDLKKYYADFSRFIQNYNRYCSDSEKVRYIFVPEMHKDSAWHIHGLLKGIRPDDLYTNQYGYLGWKQYEKKFGFISFGLIKNKEKTSTYITKYITKDVAKTISELGAHTYYASKGLKTGEEVFSGHARLRKDQEWDYQHVDGYVCIKTIPADDSLLQEVLEILE